VVRGLGRLSAYAFTAATLQRLCGGEGLQAGRDAPHVAFKSKADVSDSLRFASNLICSCGETQVTTAPAVSSVAPQSRRHLLGKRRELLGLIGQYRKLVLCIAMMGFTAFAD